MKKKNTRRHDLTSMINWPKFRNEFELRYLKKKQRGVYSLVDVANECGMSRPTLFNMTIYRTASLNAFIRACAWLNKPVDYFVKQHEVFIIQQRRQDNANK